MLALTNISHLLSLVPPLHYPVQHLLLERNWNNFISHFPMYPYVLFPLPGMSSTVPLPNSDYPSTQFKLHVLCDTFPDCLHAEVADPLVCSPSLITLSRGYVSQYTVTSFKAEVIFSPDLARHQDWQYELKDFVNEWLNTQILKKKSNLVSRIDSITWINVWPPQVLTLKEPKFIGLLTLHVYNMLNL